ncbi:HAD-IIIA family hydrolase [Lachnotalea glycerini]|uniref:HAD-IIIA family hydrolase n=1 Tax=Lachnotalea glycerini TaxID=1763509 RepID=A0A371JG75_9FIRM|nr:HAD-IIIA family hydrolase [Lachnotalea glycerini]RDY31725.1 HAD-IIIA family hydrolase [Lachnotalea glycerini]
MHVVIMAGGKGTRIASISNDVPKPMMQVCGKPILEHQIECLKKQNLCNITLIVGYLGKVIVDYFKDGHQLEVNIDYIVEETPLGTAGALFYLKESIKDDFLLLNGDIIFDVDFRRFLDYHKKHNGYATILTHPNSHPYDSGLIITDKEGKVSRWLNKEDNRTYYRNRVNAGIHILSPKVFQYFSDLKKMDLDRDILKKLIQNCLLVAYDSPEYVKDMGTPDRYEMVIKDLQSGLVEAKNLKNRQKAFFLDRDGTINAYKGFIRSVEEIELIDGVAEAIAKINASGYLAIVVTNQPVVARGEATFEEVERMHQKIETLLGEQGAYLDDIFYCPHHPDKGFQGERPELKIICDCRKPKPGMLFEAATKYNIDVKESYMIGDGINDLMAGIAAGCKSYLVKSENNKTEGYQNLKEVVIHILEDKEIL